MVMKKVSPRWGVTSTAFGPVVLLSGCWCTTWYVSTWSHHQAVEAWVPSIQSVRPLVPFRHRSLMRAQLRGADYHDNEEENSDTEWSDVASHSTLLFEWEQGSTTGDNGLEDSDSSVRLDPVPPPSPLDPELQTREQHATWSAFSQRMVEKLVPPVESLVERLAEEAAQRSVDRWSAQAATKILLRSTTTAAASTTQTLAHTVLTSSSGRKILPLVRRWAQTTTTLGRKLPFRLAGPRFGLPRLFTPRAAATAASVVPTAAVRPGMLWARTHLLGGGRLLRRWGPHRPAAVGKQFWMLFSTVIAATSRFFHRPWPRAAASARFWGATIRRPSQRRILLALRFGRGMMVTLPILGGLFAIYLVHSDIQRLREEVDIQDPSTTITPRSGWWGTPRCCYLFAGAALADGVDSLMHFLMAYALWIPPPAPGWLTRAGSTSSLCGLVSATCAVTGEVISHLLEIRRGQRRQQQLALLSQDSFHHEPME